MAVSVKQVRYACDVTETPETPDVRAEPGTDSAADAGGLGAVGVAMVLAVVFSGVGIALLLGRIAFVSDLDARLPYLTRPIAVVGILIAAWWTYRLGMKHRQIVRDFGMAGPLALLSATLPALGGFVLLGSLNIVGPWLQDQGNAGLGIYVAAFALLAGCALLPTYAQAVLGGWAFGFALGFPAAMLGFAGGSLIGYELGRRASGDHVLAMIEKRPTWKAVLDALTRSGRWRTLGIVTLLRVPPNSPFALTNLALSSVKIPRGTYLIATVVGMAPRTAIAVWIAAEIEGVINAEAVKAAKPKWMVIAIIISAVVVIGIIGRIANKAIEKVAGAGTSGESPHVEDAEGREPTNPESN